MTIIFINIIIEIISKSTVEEGSIKVIINGVEIDLSKLENRLPENKVKAIKEVQEKTGASLKDAKDAVDAYVASCPKEPRPASYCSKCGAGLSAGAKFCGVCGASVYSSGQTSGQEWQQLADSAKVAAKASVENARKNVAKGLGAAGEKIVSAADKMQQSGKAEEISRESAENERSEKTGPGVQSADIGAGAERTSSDRPKGRKKWKIGLGAAAVILILIWIVGGSSGKEKYISMVKGSTLYAYDYGISIGDSLHRWFAGTEQWDSYEDDGDIYVTAIGDCPYSLTGTGERQMFSFEIVDKEHFKFTGAVNMDGEPICTDSGNDILNAYVGAVLDWMSPLYNLDFYEEAVKAAFGNEESLEMFKEMVNEM